MSGNILSLFLPIAIRPRGTPSRVIVLYVCANRGTNPRHMDAVFHSEETLARRLLRGAYYGRLPFDFLDLSVLDIPTHSVQRCAVVTS